MIRAAVCAAAGLALAVGGYWLVKSAEVPEGDSSFAGLLSSRSLRTAGGWAGLFLGLLMAFIGAPMLYLTP